MYLHLHNVCNRALLRSKASKMLVSPNRLFTTLPLSTTTHTKVHAPGLLSKGVKVCGCVLWKWSSKMGGRSSGTNLLQLVR